MNKKDHFKLLTLGFISLLLIGSISFIYAHNINNKTQINTHNTKNFIKKIPLYYNINNPNVIYTRNSSGDFEVIEINDQ